MKIALAILASFGCGVFITLVGVYVAVILYASKN